MLFEVKADRIRDFALYIVFGLLFSCAILWFALHDIDVNWLSLVFETCLVFGCAIGINRRLWRQPAFWLCLFALIGVHFVLLGALIRQVQLWRAPIMGATFVIETSIVSAISHTAALRIELRKRKARQPL